MRNLYYEHRHTIRFEETNLVGTVDRTSYERWQGQCLELFLLEYAPEVLDALAGDLALSVAESDFEHLAPVFDFDEVSIRMRLAELTPARIGLTFDFVRIRDGREELVARGRQRLVCVRHGGPDGSVPERVLPELENALRRYVISSADTAVAGTGGRA